MDLQLLSQCGSMSNCLSRSITEIHWYVAGTLSICDSTVNTPNRLVGLVVKAFASRAEDPRFESRLHREFFRGQVIPVTEKLSFQWLPCQAPGIKGSVLGLVGRVSVYCDWVRWKVGSATAISVWQHVKLSEQISP